MENSMERYVNHPKHRTILPDKGETVKDTIWNDIIAAIDECYMVDSICYNCHPGAECEDAYDNRDELDIAKELVIKLYNKINNEQMI